jgi:PilZ domain
MDRRQRRRFDVSAPVTYIWANSDATEHSAAGVTRDVSESGVFIIGDSLPPVGATVQFEVSFSFRDDSQIEMRAHGKVLRVEATGSDRMPRGFAAATDQPVLARPSELAPGEGRTRG